MESDAGVDVRELSRRERFRRHPIDGRAAKSLVHAGLTWLRTNQAEVNNLNVFPVPDGDTGTNMVLTMQNAYAEVVIQNEYFAPGDQAVVYVDIHWITGQLLQRYNGALPQSQYVL